MIPELREIPACAGYYASACGRIFSRWHRVRFGPMQVDVSREPRELRQFDSRTLRGGRSPYLSVNLTRDGKRCNRFVHELVLLAWAGERPGPAAEVEACHGPLGSRDNRLSNLRWDTVQHNAWDRERARDPGWEPPNAHDGDDGEGHAFSDMIGVADGA